MNANLGRGSRVRLRTIVRKHLERLNNDGLDEFLGRLDMLAARVQPSRSLTVEEAERQVQEWQRLVAGIDTGETADVDDRAGTEACQFK